MSSALSSIKAHWRDVVAGFWLVPGVVALLGPALAAFLLAVDHGLGHINIAFVFQGSPSSARSILSTIASSLITVAALIFTLTITTLQLASSQFTPRALRGFLSDRVTQVVAGAFVGIFAYCLIVLTTVRSKGESGSSFVPAVSVTAAILLALIAVALLLVFIHHTTQSIQVSNITARIAHSTLKTLDHLYPQAGTPLHADGADLVRAWYAAGAPYPIYPTRPGYVQSIALDDLISSIARAGGRRLHLLVCPGDFVAPQTCIAEIWPAEGLAGQIEATVHHQIVVVSQRDMHQDAAFGVRQLADIALKAMSPGINDPTTAVTAIGYLGAILARLARHELPASVRRDDVSHMTVVVRQRPFEEYVEALVEIGRVSTTNARVAGALLEALADIGAAARACRDPRRLTIVAEVAETVAAPAIAAAQTDHDRLLLTERRAQLARMGRPRVYEGACMRKEGRQT